MLSKNVTLSEITEDSYNLSNKKTEIPSIFYEVNTQMFKETSPMTDLEKIQYISIWLVKHIKGGSGLSLSSKKALEVMLDGKGGVCSDMAQIFNNFCLINDLKVREWGVTLIPFNTNFGGHSFNEVYCKELNKWVFIDVSYCLMFYKDSKALPLSVIELFEQTRNEQFPKLDYFNEAIKANSKVIDNYYFNSQAAPFLICNYSTKTYDRFLDIFRPLTPVFVIHFLILLLGKSYRYKFPINNYKLLFVR